MKETANIPHSILKKAYSLLNQALEMYRKVDAKKKIGKIIAKKKLLTA